MESLESVGVQLTKRLDPNQTEALSAYVDLVLAANARAGLMAKGVGRADLTERHLPEALEVASVLHSRGNVSPLVDVGSGGGLPGIPIAIVLPEVSVTLVEATAKKAAFLVDAARSLRMANVNVVNARAEEVARSDAHRESYATVTARAVAPLATLLELTLPFLEIGGVLAAVKGSRARAEIAESGVALDTLGGEVEEVMPSGVSPNVTIVLVRKKKSTPPEFPRRDGMPKKRPLR
jgi:16S rRNA (guanine527-N7)-methyltransferase